MNKAKKKKVISKAVEHVIENYLHNFHSFSFVDALDLGEDTKNREEEGGGGKRGKNDFLFSLICFFSFARCSQIPSFLSSSSSSRHLPRCPRTAR